MDKKKSVRKIGKYNYCLRKRVKYDFKGFRKYMFFAFLNGLIMFIFLWTFTSLIGINYIISFLFAYVIMVSNSFLFNKFYVFNRFCPRKVHKLYIGFLQISVVAFLINLTLLFFLVDLLGVFYLLAQFSIAILGFPILFVFYRKRVFGYV